MVKQARRTAARPQKQKVKVPRSIRTGLDAQGLAWAHLLNDPCGAALVHPCYAGADGGILMRFENQFEIGTGATDTAGLFAYTPNGIGTNGAAIISGVAANAATNLTLAFGAAAAQPGYSFLQTNSSNVKAVASCIQIVYLGTELNRSGVINYGNITGGTFFTGDTPNTSNASNVFEHFCRIPNGTIEIKWRPTAYDQSGTDVGQATVASNQIRNGAMGFSFSGLVASAGLRVRMVTVYEYTPNNQVGIAQASRSRSTSQSTLDNVINYLDSTGDWMVRLGDAMGGAMRGVARIAPYVQAVGYAGRRIPALLM